jgi:hypothetical protein
MANEFRLTPIADCANKLCPNKVGEGQFVVVNIRTLKNVGYGSGLIQLIMCSPCATAIASDSIAVPDPAAETPKVRLTAVEPAG